MTPEKLLREYLVDHDLRPASAKIYGAAMKKLEKNFGNAVDVETIDRRDVLALRNKLIEGGLSKRSWNTYSNHLRTIWGYGIEYGILPNTDVNPFKKTTVIAPKRQSKIIAGEAIVRARRWLRSLADQEESTGDRARITPAWFWLATFEMFYYTGIRLNALLCIRLKDVDWDRRLVLVRGETEKTHREFRIPIMDGLAPHIQRLVDEAGRAGFAADDQLFNVNRFSRHYKRHEMNSDQVEAMYKKLIIRLGVRMTPHRFRHTLATDLMKQPERNIHLTKNLLNHSNIATTMSYIEADYDHMRDVLHERSMQQGALRLVRRVDESSAPNSRPGESGTRSEPGRRITIEQDHQGGGCSAPEHLLIEFRQSCASALLPPEDLFQPSLLFSLMASTTGSTPFARSHSADPGTVYNARASPKF
ncbi:MULTISPECIES: site-specific integrase [Pseudomonas]|uniref:Recombinase XerC n=2 Tax=Pseudomonas TaxID=286 RepID=A0A2S3WQB0_PSEPU|nr:MULTISPECIES: site-specific integrase [Pseudomonas]MBI6918071.1 site-specific integrase [Pseudomonas monteilii]MCE0938024.1 site-specific integrase [Pseudomonas kurunegalensis]MDD2017895.1 site-specific integrase [Pseudomonas putida]PKF24036.1 recombinase XerC [Pseudomonas hunanensis]POG03606.1 recombinase XerC [Pseudomonas putida]